VAVVIPVHRGGSDFDRCLEAVTAADPPAERIVVVVDGDDPAARAAAERFGVETVEVPVSGGPAAARNLGADATDAELILFVDSDVVIARDAIGRVRQYLTGRPEVAAVFGSYDDSPPAPGFWSRFKNLLHHFTHQLGSEEAATFWTGCGAVRRAVFRAVGGFDPAQQWLEDVELGYRLRAAGYRIRLDRELRVTHLKRWSLRSLLKSDILHRALPWTELIHRYRMLPNDLNLRTGERVSAALVMLLAAALVVSAWWRWALAPAVAAIVGLMWLNAPLYRFFRRRQGPLFVLRAIPMHWFYLLYSGIVFGLGTLWWGFRPADQSSARARSRSA
jgi:GT2 family glycosyltransferase